MMYFNGYYKVSHEGHDRYYGVVSKPTPEEAFEFLYKEILEIVKSPSKITECYVDHCGEITPTSKGFKFRTLYGFSDKRDIFKNGFEHCICKYIELKRPTL